MQYVCSCSFSIVLLHGSVLPDEVRNCGAYELVHRSEELAGEWTLKPQMNPDKGVFFIMRVQHSKHGRFNGFDDVI
ncbi:hypothetical protein ACE41H_19065 [Paenibacillus enshidis]|uniref:Uncharacterized protein n=1 Tax=Paenibacillus enshidis TaxID=1458439 RepID=A0ABV5AXD2_9BACL